MGEPKKCMLTTANGSSVFFSAGGQKRLITGYFHLCPRMDFLQTLHINNSL